MHFLPLQPGAHMQWPETASHVAPFSHSHTYIIVSCRSRYSISRSKKKYTCLLAVLSKVTGGAGLIASGIHGEFFPWLIKYSFIASVYSNLVLLCPSLTSCPSILPDRCTLHSPCCTRHHSHNHTSADSSRQIVQRGTLKWIDFF